MKICKVGGCNREVRAKGYCTKHYYHISKHGKILERTKFTPNEIIIHKGYAEIVIYKGFSKQTEIARTKIDLDNVDKIKDLRWHLSDQGYPTSNLKGKKIKLHQLILGKIKGLDIDHKDVDPLNNQESNLRHCTHRQNGMNKKNVKGYSWCKSRNKWEVRIKVNCKKIFLGRFETEQEAIKVRKEAEIKYFKEFRYNKYA